MTLSQRKLQRRLTRLEASIPAMMYEHPDSADFNEVFTARADEITDSASTDDSVWVFGEVDRILEKFDLWHPNIALRDVTDPSQDQIPVKGGNA